MMMLWLHLFGYYDTVEQCSNYLTFWNGDHLAYVLKKLCSMCVPIYVFLGGYGLTKTYISTISSQYASINNVRRVLALYANFWIVFLLSYPIGCILNPSLFLNNPFEIFANAIAFDSTFNGAWWFLFPYVLITLASARLIKFLKDANRNKIICYFVATIALFVIAYVRLEDIDSHDFISLIEVNIWRTSGMLLMFGIGIMFALHNVVERFPLPKNNIILWIILIALILLKLSLGAASLLHPPFVLVMTLIWCRLQHGKYITTFLTFMGKHSTNLWLTHYFFFAYIAHGEIYGLKYPIVIFLVLVIVSILTSMVIDVINKPIRRFCRFTQS